MAISTLLNPAITVYKYFSLHLWKAFIFKFTSDSCMILSCSHIWIVDNCSIAISCYSKFFALLEVALISLLIILVLANMLVNINANKKIKINEVIVKINNLTGDSGCMINTTSLVLYLVY